MNKLSSAKRAEILGFRIEGVTPRAILGTRAFSKIPPRSYWKPRVNIARHFFSEVRRD